MIGAIVGDIIGSAYQFGITKQEDFDLFPSKARFTDDTVMSIAVADAILNNRIYTVCFKEYGRYYSDAGYGNHFYEWLMSEDVSPYGSFGNGAAMRVSPIGFAFNNLQDVLDEAKRSAEVTHNHPEGIKGAQCVASAIFLAREGKSKKEICNFVEGRFGYDLSLSLAAIRPDYKFDETCQGSVPQAIIAFRESEGFEDAIRKGVSLGGDSDTIACMIGGIAQAYYKKIPDHILKIVNGMLPTDFLKIIERFQEKYKYECN